MLNNNLYSNKNFITQETFYTELKFTFDINCEMDFYLHWMNDLLDLAYTSN